MIIPRRNTNSVKNAIAPKISPVMPPNAFVDLNPIKEVIKRKASKNLINGDFIKWSDLQPQ